ncbi:tail assembly chaperone [Erwinia phage AH03]|uniref:Tail assembly chaperone n=1 Tax=Erwinia phage AH03 TaxID=2869568 RepID=A0AAE7X0L8_9CAUD|nr:tail assembly chaperone [Erwinia phage AH03]
MSLYKNFGTNAELESKGIELEYGLNDDGSVIKFTIARSAKSNKKYQKAMETTFKPYRRQMQLNTMPEETASRLMLEVFVTTILKGWENVQDEAGNDLAFNKDNAMKLLTDLPELFDDLQEKAGNVANFRDETLEEDAKN